MQYEATNPDEYLNQIDNDWRKVKLEEIREMIKSNGSELIEDIEYKMLCYKKGKQSIFHLNAQKSYVSLYVGNIGNVKDSEALLKGFDIGKGCVRIRKNMKLSETKLEEFISEVISLWYEGGNTDC